MLARREQLFLQDIENTLRRFTGAQVTRYATGIMIKAASAKGFDMSVMVDDGRYALYLDNWTEEFESDDLARRTFEAALTGEARLRVDALSGRAWRWTLETLDEAGNWVAESTTSHVVWRFWGRPSVIYLRNVFVRELPDLSNESPAQAR